MRIESRALPCVEARCIDEHASTESPGLLYLPRSPRRTRRWAQRSGSLIPLVAGSLVVLVVAAAFSVDTAYLQLARTEMRGAVDASARSAGQVLASGGSSTSAQNAAKAVALENKVAGKPLQLSDSDIVLGNASRSAGGAYLFTPGGSPGNAFQISGRRTRDSLGGQINAIFGGILGVSRYNAIQSATVVRGDRDVLLVLDTSGSMMYRLEVDQSYPSGRSESTPPHPNESRWGVLCQSLGVLFNTLESTSPEEQVGLVTFDTQGAFRSSLNTEYKPVQSRVDEFSSAPLAGWTNLGEGMQLARERLISGLETKPYSARTIILLTDGQPNQGPDPMEEARACKSAKITVHTISFSSFADTQLMQSIADTTGGKYYAAPSEATLRAAFQEIGRDLPVLLTQ